MAKAIQELGYRRGITEAEASTLRAANLIYDSTDGFFHFTTAHMEACGHDIRRAAAFVDRLLDTPAQQAGA